MTVRSGIAALGVVVAVAVSARSQIPTAPPIPAVPAVPGGVPNIPPLAGQAAATGATSPLAAAASAPPTIFDFLGFKQISQGLKKLVGEILGIPIIQFADQTLIKPTLQTLGLAPSPGLSAIASQTGAAGPAAASGGAPGAAGGAPGAPQPPPSATGLAVKLKGKQAPANVKLKVEAIRFLATQDCVCYPEVVDALLASLDDCAEAVRYEALKTLRNGCARNRCSVCGKTHKNERSSCHCQVKVLTRLSDLLLERDVQGRLKERSLRVRQLAKSILNECLQTTPIRPAGQPQAEPDPPLATPSDNSSGSNNQNNGTR